jgi:hypothetical protein
VDRIAAEQVEVFSANYRDGNRCAALNMPGED